MSVLTDVSLSVDEILDKATQAAAVFSQLDQAHTDRIVRAVVRAGLEHRVRLARMAQEETGIGRWQDKVVKNFLATQMVYDSIADLKTVGVISEDHLTGITEIAQPMGPILAIVPVTNPTSTVLFKVIIALKSRNPLIISPNRQASRSSCEAARICYEAALSEDAPEDCIQWLTESSRERTQALMSHRGLALVLATGGQGLVRQAYSSGTPALGVGAGNVPVFIEASADVPFAVDQILESKTFDHGTVCASEQYLILESSIAQEALDCFRQRGAYLVRDEELPKLEEAVFDRARGLMRAEIVGRSPQVVARRAGFEVPPETSILLAPLAGVGEAWPLSSEILAPVLAFKVASDFQEAVNLCIEINFYGGIGHTVSIFSNDEARIRDFSLAMNAGRILVNTPSSQGGVGGIFNTLEPSLTLGCGTSGKNITTDNVSARHLLNIQRVTRRRDNLKLQRMGTAILLDESKDAAQIEREYRRNS